MQFEDMSLKKGTATVHQTRNEANLAVKTEFKILSKLIEENQHAVTDGNNFINCFMVTFQREMKSMQ